MTINLERFSDPLSTVAEAGELISLIKSSYSTKLSILWLHRTRVLGFCWRCGVRSKPDGPQGLEGGLGEAYLIQLVEAALDQFLSTCDAVE